MAEQTLEPQTDNPRVAIWQHAATAVLVLGFIAAGWLRLNDCDLFNPDSPRYLIYAQSLAETGQYRAIDTPGAPLYTWRPPGLPILLAPVLKFLPYDVVAAKCVVLFTAVLLLIAVHAVASSTGARWFGPLMVCILGTSPMMLSMATEVLSEVPYALGILLVLILLGRSDHAGENRRGAFWGALAALAFTPILRTVGVALVAAVGLWSLSARRRWKYLIAVAVASAGLGWLAWRSRLAPGGNYAGSMMQTIREHGVEAVIAEAMRTVSFYWGAFPGVLLPGLTSEQTFYAPMVVGNIPSLSGGVWTALLALLVAAVGIVGLWRERSRCGWVGLLYIMLYCACLAIWPFRHERFLWPLVPLIWAFVPAGLNLISTPLPVRLRQFASPVLVMGILAVCVWQAVGSATLVSTNQRFLANRDAFYRDEAPGFYFSDWRQAGRWIHDNSPPQARLITWQAAVGGTAHRFQRRVQLEALTPEKVRQQIASFPARYVVVTTSHFGLGFGWQQAFADPAYTFTEVYHDRDVAILEVTPNRTGSISRTGYLDWVRNQRTALDAVLARSPGRTDLIARKSDLLQIEGHNDQAIALLEGLIHRGMVTVRVCSSLGWLYYAEGKYARAAEYLDLASVLPNAEGVAESLVDGARRARERMLEPTDHSPDKSIERSLRRVSVMVASLNFIGAERELDKALPEAPDHAELNYWRGYLHHLFDEREQAQVCYQRAVRSGSKDASGKMLLLETERAIHQSAASVVNENGSEAVDPNVFATYVHLARLYDEHGWSGRALATLEAARQRFGDRPEILSPLADLNMRFAWPEEAAALYKLALNEWPNEKSLKQGLAAAEAALRKPRF